MQLEKQTNKHRTRWSADEEWMSVYTKEWVKFIRGNLVWSKNFKESIKSENIDEAQKQDKTKCYGI